MPGQAGAGTTDRCKSHPQVEWQSGFQFLSHKRMGKDRYSSRLGGLSFHRAKLLMICITVATLFMPCLGCAQGQKDDGSGSCVPCTGGKYQDENAHTYTVCKNCGKGQYVHDDDLTKCKTCPIGRYNDQAPVTSCTTAGNLCCTQLLS